MKIIKPNLLPVILAVVLGGTIGDRTAAASISQETAMAATREELYGALSQVTIGSLAAFSEDTVVRFSALDGRVQNALRQVFPYGSGFDHRKGCLPKDCMNVAVMGKILGVDRLTPNQILNLAFPGQDLSQFTLRDLKFLNDNATYRDLNNLLGTAGRQAYLDLPIPDATLNLSLSSPTAQKILNTKIEKFGRNIQNQSFNKFLGLENVSFADLPAIKSAIDANNFQPVVGEAITIPRVDFLGKGESGVIRNIGQIYNNGQQEAKCDPKCDFVEFVSPIPGQEGLKLPANISGVGGKGWLTGVGPLERGGKHLLALDPDSTSGITIKQFVRNVDPASGSAKLGLAMGYCIDVPFAGRHCTPTSLVDFDIFTVSEKDRNYVLPMTAAIFASVPPPIKPPINATSSASTQPTNPTNSITAANPNASKFIGANNIYSSAVGLAVNPALASTAFVPSLGVNLNTYVNSNI